jgi:enoyl-CoA hydratase/carnithine racemase
MTIDYTRRGHLVTITLNRPGKLNAIDEAMQAELASAWRRYESDDEAWLAILTGEGRVFSAGADKSWFERMQRGEDSAALFLDAIGRDPYWSGTIHKPSIVAVNGAAVGAGVDLALRADLRVADDEASFRMPEVDVGSFMLLWENLPHAITAEMLSGASLSAQRAHQVGLVNRLAPPGTALAVATAWADELLAKPPLVLAGALKMLRTLRNSNAIPPARSLREESSAQSRRWAHSDDVKEAVASMLQRRKPAYRRR